MKSRVFSISFVEGCTNGEESIETLQNMVNAVVNASTASDTKVEWLQSSTKCITRLTAIVTNNAK
ncbi:MAG: hypothetical protein Q7S12_02300 [bacterium]|nr:hypothetical protein [bacterium]